jgi:hypothetical protein
MAELSVDDWLRILAFVIGFFVFIWGLADYGSIAGSVAITGLSLAATGSLKVIVGLFLMIAGINPDAVRMIVNVIIRR